MNLAGCFHAGDSQNKVQMEKVAGPQGACATCEDPSGAQAAEPCQESTEQILRATDFNIKVFREDPEDGTGTYAYESWRSRISLPFHATR